jgi:hypothetical protein
VGGGLPGRDLSRFLAVVCQTIDDAAVMETERSLRKDDPEFVVAVGSFAVAEADFVEMQKGPLVIWNDLAMMSAMDAAR